MPRIPSTFSRTHSRRGRIVAELDKYIIGQDKAKHSVAIALRNRWRAASRSRVRCAMRSCPTTSFSSAPPAWEKPKSPAVFRNSPARPSSKSKLPSSPKSAMWAAMWSRWSAISWKSQSIRCGRKKRRSAGKSPRSGRGTHSRHHFSALAGSGRRHAVRNREKLRAQLRAGALDKREIEVEVNASGSANMQVFGPMGLEDMGVDLQNLLNS